MHREHSTGLVLHLMAIVHHFCKNMPLGLKLIFIKYHYILMNIMMFNNISLFITIYIIRTMVIVQP